MWMGTVDFNASAVMSTSPDTGTPSEDVAHLEILFHKL
jgi:hypothetical protein